MPRLTWKREAREKGLAGVCQGERGWDLNYGAGNRVGSVHPLYKGFSREKIGYYFVARHDGLGIPWRNTSADPSTPPFATADEAKAACLAYVQQHMSLE